jgi:hypothetical protein
MGILDQLMAPSGTAPCPDQMARWHVTGGVRPFSGIPRGLIQDFQLQALAKQQFLYAPGSGER